MKAIFRSLDDIEEFIKLASELESDVTVGSGNKTIDGKSQMGMMQLTLNEEYPVSFVVRNQVEVLAFANVLKERGIAK